MEKFGHFLKAHRESKGIRLEEISSITKIHIHSLQMIEEDRWDDLPPEPFVRGFIVAYSKYIGLNPKEALQKFNELAKGQTPPAAPGLTDEPSATEQNTLTSEQPIPTLTDPTRLINQPRTLPLKPIGYGLAALTVLGILVTIMTLGRQSQRPSETIAMETTPEVVPSPDALVELAKTSETDKKAAERQPAAQVAPTAEAPKPAPTTVVTEESAHVLEVTSKDRTWIKVVVDEAPPIEYFLGAGQKASYSAKQKIKVVLGNSTDAEVVHNGQKAPGVKFQGTIRSYIFPADARFPQDVPKRAITETTAQTAPTTSDDN